MKWRIFVGLILCVLLGHAAEAAPPTYQQVRGSYQKSDALLLDRNHEPIHELRIDRYGRRLDWVPLKDISPVIQSAIIYAEDRRFYQHSGVDWRAIGAALIEKLLARKPRGASTITMQLASVLNKKLQAAKNRRSFWQKWTQIQEARNIEKSWSKAEILEAYLNLVTFRGELNGIGAASRGLFDKEPHGLDRQESLILASLVRAPNASISRVSRRACWLASAMKLEADCEVVTARARQRLTGPYIPRPQVALAPHVALQLLESHRGKTERRELSVVSTLDGRLQRFAAEVLKEHLLSVRDQNVQDGALLVVENKSGDVLAYIGNSGDLASARHVDGIHAQRQAGSTLKPFLYTLALEKRLLTAASILDDSPLDVSVETGIYRPRNYDSQFQGLVTARVALASSLNVPAVKTLHLVGTESFAQTLRQLGFAGVKEDGDFYGPSLALGSADVSLWELVNAYRTLANEGVWSELRLTLEKNTQPSSKRLFSREAAFIVSDILSDRESRSHTFGLESPLSTRFWSAVKTGTSKDMRDNWCVGYSDRYTVGVWVGNFSGSPMWNVSGVTGAAPVWLEIMNWLHQNQSSRARKTPEGVAAKKVAPMQNASGRMEWFIKGTEPEVTRQAVRQVNHRILYPASGTVVTLDPDIPSEQQRLFFESEPRDDQLRWVLNGEEVGPAGSTLFWQPHPGKHTLALVHREGRIVDAVSFAVRGAREEESSELMIGDSPAPHTFIRVQ